MRSSSGNYEIIITSGIAGQIRRLHREAARSQKGRAFIESFRIIVNRLSEGAESFGEPSYNLPALRLQVRCAVVAPIVVHFGVAHDRRVVYVKGVDTLSE